MVLGLAVQRLYRTVTRVQGLRRLWPAEVLVPVVPRSVPPMLLAFPPPLSCKLIFDVAANRYGSCIAFTQLIRSARLDSVLLGRGGLQILAARCCATGRLQGGVRAGVTCDV